MATVTDATALHVTRVNLSKIPNSTAGISVDMALRLSQWLGTSPDRRLGQQAQFDLWQTEAFDQPAKIATP